MTGSAQSFFTRVVEPNVLDVRKNPEDLRAIVNAVLTIDAFFGIMAKERFFSNDGDYNDSDYNDVKYKDELATKHEPWQLLRDLAFSLKHGQLTKKHPRLVRLVRSPDAVVEKEGRWDDADVWDDEGPGLPSDTQMFVSYDGGHVRPVRLICSVGEFAKAEMDGAQHQTVSPAAIKSGVY